MIEKEQNGSKAQTETYLITSSIYKICIIGTLMVEKGTKTLNDD